MKSLPIYSLVGHAFVVLFLIATTAGASVSESLTGKVIGWPPIRNEREIGKLVSRASIMESPWMRTTVEISGSCWNPVDESLWVVQSNPQVAFRIQFVGESVEQEHAIIESFPVDTWAWGENERDRSVPVSRVRTGGTWTTETGRRVPSWTPRTSMSSTCCRRTPAPSSGSRI